MRSMRGWVSRSIDRRWLRLAFLALGIASLATGVWGGLVRLPMNLPLPPDNANWITYHGPLMVCGFLGTVIGLERAVGLQRGWAYAAPVLTGASALWIALGQMSPFGAWGMVGGSAVYMVVALYVVKLQRVLFTAVMALGAVCWLVGNCLWLAGWQFARVVPWWVAFLGLVIAGERLDLSRFQKLPDWARPAFLLALGIFLAGLMVGVALPSLGGRLAAMGLLGMAVWLARWDLARRTVRQPGLPRFMAICLLSGYGWLAFSACLWLTRPVLEPGLRYDAVLHAFFVGFVFSMIFGHAPMIFPSILGLPAVFRSRFYIHVAGLHVSLALRVVGDLANVPGLRRWGAILNGVVVLLFFASTAPAILATARAGRGGPIREGRLR